MTRPLALLAALVLTACAAPDVTSRALTVTHDLGGATLARMATLDTLRAQRRSVAVTGTCASACTLYLALVRDGLLCTTPNAKWLFHGAHSGSADANAWVNVLMSMSYPPQIAARFVNDWQHLGPSEYATVTGAEMIRAHGVPQC